MGFARRYSDAQRAAIVSAVLERDLTGAEARRRAAAGTLAPELEAFDIPAGTVRDLVATARRRAAGTAALERGAASTLAALAAELAAELQRQTRRARARSADPATVAGDLHALARAGREILQLERATSSSTASPGATSTSSSAETAPAGLVERLAERAAQHPPHET